MGKDVSYSHLRVFGCKTFVYVTKEQRSKLDDKVVFLVMVMKSLDSDYGIQPRRNW